MRESDINETDFLPDNEYDITDDKKEKDQKYEHYRFVADKGQGLLRVDKFLTLRIEGVSRNRLQQAAEANNILVNGLPVKSNYKVKPRDVISVMLDWPKREFEIIPEDIPLNIVYEDDYLMVINKPPGMVVHPAPGNFTSTLVNAVAYHLNYGHIKSLEDPRLGLVHRIDKDTSGLLLVAKTPQAKSDLSGQFIRKETRRSYVALVWGNVENNEGTIEVNIGRDPKDRMVMTAFPDGKLGKTAVTHYKVLERFGYVTFVQCRLETGRTHQIRVHMKYIGHTLFNDERYGGDKILRGTHFAKYKQFVHNCFSLCPRQCLHAQALGFVHPATKEALHFESDIPDDMQAVIEKWRDYTAAKERSL